MAKGENSSANIGERFVFGDNITMVVIKGKPLLGSLNSVVLTPLRGGEVHCVGWLSNHLDSCLPSMYSLGTPL